MDIRYYSDLHLEHMDATELKTFLQKMNTVPITDNTVCLLAGDIGHPRNPHYDLFFQNIHRHFPKTFVIPGNHEYYSVTRTNTIEQTNAWMEDYFQKYENITLLNNSWEIYKGYCFIGSVLWTHIFNPERTITDMGAIPDFNVEKYNALNKTCVEFLQEAIHSNERCIVMTHHMPSEQLIDPKYKNSTLMPYNQWFFCDVEYLFVKDRVTAWFYGHTHTPLKTTLREVPFLCNPNGYPHEDSGFQFDSLFTIE